jgi:hypothetical protein
VPGNIARPLKTQGLFGREAQCIQTLVVRGGEKEGSMRKGPGEVRKVMFESMGLSGGGSKIEDGNVQNGIDGTQRPSACADQGLKLEKMERCTLEWFRRWRSSTRGKGMNVSWENAACSQRRSS